MGTHSFVNILKTIELHPLNEPMEWYADYILIKRLKIT